MYAVLYTHQLEPITVVDLPMWAMDRIRHGEQFSVPVAEPVSFSTDELVYRMRVVRIVGDRLRRGKHEMVMLFTADEESALLLKSEFLPGQRSELIGRERSAFAKGFLKALHTQLRP